MTMRKGPSVRQERSPPTPTYPYYALSGVFVVPGVILTPTTLTVNEGSTADYTVELSVQPTADVTVDITGGGDVSVNPTSLTFTATTWDTAQTVTVTAAQDTDAADDAQTVGHAVASSSASEYVGATLDGLAVTVDDDEDPAVTVSFELGTYSVAEGGSVTVKVQLSADPEREVVVLLTTTNQGGASSGDYSGVPAASPSRAATPSSPSPSPRPRTPWSTAGRA